MSYWRTSSGTEVDCVIGDARVAIEIKSVTELQPRHLKGLQTFGDEHPNVRKIAVTLDTNRRMLNGVEVLPIMEFLDMLWTEDV